MTAKERERHDCIQIAWIKALTWVIGIIILVGGAALASQDSRIKRVEQDHDTIIELKTTIEHMAEALDDIKEELSSRHP